MQTKLKIVAICALAAASIGTAAHAQRGGPGMSPFMDFTKADADGDGQISMAELQAQQAALRAGIDTDKNGALSVEELTADRIRRVTERAGAQVAEFVAAHDTNGDQQLSAEEMPAPRDLTKVFKRLDTNADGTISLAEAEDAKTRMQHHRGKHKGNFAE